MDYVTGPELSGGVFIVVRTEDRRLQSDLSYLKMGKGPYYAFYQPSHNWFIDMPISVARAVLGGEESVPLLSKPTCQVVAVAKKNLKKGEPLGGIGGYGTYGVLYRMDEARKEALLPHGLVAEATAAADISRGKAILLRDVTLNDSSHLVQLWRGLQ